MTDITPNEIPDTNPVPLGLLSQFGSNGGSEATNALLRELVAEVRGLREDLARHELHREITRLGLRERSHD